MTFLFWWLCLLFSLYFNRISNILTSSTDDELSINEMILVFCDNFFLCPFLNIIEYDKLPEFLLCPFSSNNKKIFACAYSGHPHNVRGSCVHTCQSLCGCKLEWIHFTFPDDLWATVFDLAIAVHFRFFGYLLPISIYMVFMLLLTCFDLGVPIFGFNTTDERLTLRCRYSMTKFTIFIQHG